MNREKLSLVTGLFKIFPGYFKLNRLIDFALAFLDINMQVRNIFFPAISGNYPNTKLF